MHSKAIELLRDDNLVWSMEFELIRHDLADLLESVEKLLDAATALSNEIADGGE